MITPERVVRQVVELRYQLPLNARDMGDLLFQAAKEFDPSGVKFDDTFWVRSDGESLIITSNLND